MAMPAVQAFRALNPDAHIGLLCRQTLRDLWAMHAVPDEVIGLRKGVSGIRDAVKAVRSGGFEQAWVMPNSFRSALIPFVAGIPARRGFRGHQRSLMLTQVVPLSEALEEQHQAFEAFALLGVDSLAGMPPVELRPPSRAREQADALGVKEGASFVACLPGAAFGPEKQWPVEHFEALLRRLVNEAGYRPVLLGTEAEQAICTRVAEAAGPQCLNLAGRTDLQTLAEVLRRCAATVANDSGGMHLSAAVQTPVVAVYGVTDPGKTGPVGEGHELVLAEGVSRARDLDRNSMRAVNAMRSISADTVYAALQKVLEARRNTSAESNM